LARIPLNKLRAIFARMKRMGKKVNPYRLEKARILKREKKLFGPVRAAENRRARRFKEVMGKNPDSRIFSKEALSKTAGTVAKLRLSGYAGGIGIGALIGAGIKKRRKRKNK